MVLWADSSPRTHCWIATVSFEASFPVWGPGLVHLCVPGPGARVGAVQPGLDRPRAAMSNACLGNERGTAET